MSQALRETIGAKLLGCAPLVALVGHDPVDGQSPAMFAGRKSKAPVVYPCLTYRLPNDLLDKRFRGPIGNAANKVFDVTIELEYWTQSSDTAPIEAAMAALDTLFENTTFPITGGGQVVAAFRTMGETDVYDKTLEASQGLFHYYLRYQLP